MADQQPVTARSLAAARRKQEAYAARRRAWTGQWLHRGAEAEAVPEQERQGETGRVSRGARSTIHDARQTRLDL